jgi:hypothetical protein
MCKFRDLRADEIECRVQQAKENGVVLLLYKDARVDMNILDETVGSSNWQNKFYENKGILFCSLGINTNYAKPELPDRWIWKDDAGVESNTEAEKGNASDARKRAGFAWGIGRELYTSPFIWVAAKDCNIKDGRNGSKACYDTFVVQSITIENKQITALTIYNQTKKCVAYTFGNAAKPQNPPQNVPKEQPLTYEEALEFKLNFGKYEGLTMREVWKKDAAHIKALSENEWTPERVLEAIRVINAEIVKARAK